MRLRTVSVCMEEEKNTNHQQLILTATVKRVHTFSKRFGGDKEKFPSKCRLARRHRQAEVGLRRKCLKVESGVERSKKKRD